MSAPASGVPLRRQARPDPDAGMHQLRAVGVHSRKQTETKMKRKYPPSAERAGIYQAASPEITVEENSQGITVLENETNTASLAVRQLQGYPARESESQSGNPFHEFQQELSDMFEPKKIAHLFRSGTEEVVIEKASAAEQQRFRVTMRETKRRSKFSRHKSPPSIKSH